MKQPMFPGLRYKGLTPTRIQFTHSRGQPMYNRAMQVGGIVLAEGWYVHHAIFSHPNATAG